MLNQRIVAHRGFQKLYPENTLLAFEQAVAAGALYVETDIQFSADGVPVLYHDLPMKRLSGVEQIVSTLTAEELTALPAHEPSRFGETFIHEKIPTLEAFTRWLQQYPQVTAFVEIKRSAVAHLGVEACFDGVVQYLKAVVGQIVLISFDVDFIAYVAAQKFCPVGLVLVSWDSLHQDQLKTMEFDYIFCDGEKIPPDVDLNLINPTLVVYEVSTWQEAVTWFDRGVDMVESFDVGGLIQDLGKHSF